MRNQEVIGTEIVKVAEIKMAVAEMVECGYTGVNSALNLINGKVFHGNRGRKSSMGLETTLQGMERKMIKK